MPMMHVLAHTPGILRELLTHATDDELNWQPRPDRWSISMVLAHLADVEVNGFLSRFRDMVEQENPFLPAYDQLAFFAGREKVDGRAELDRFTRLRTDSLAWLKAAPAE